MQDDYPTGGQQDPTKPVGWTNSLRRPGVHVHVEIRAEILRGELRVFGDLRQGSGTRFIEYKGIDHSELDSHQEKQYSDHEVSIAIKLHDFTSAYSSDSVHIATRI